MHLFIYHKEVLYYTSFLRNKKELRKINLGNQWRQGLLSSSQIKAPKNQADFFFFFFCMLLLLSTAKDQALQREIHPTHLKAYIWQLKWEKNKTQLKARQEACKEKDLKPVLMS